ncbi:MAG: helix-turn-helix domain-containing protein [Litoreibacter sp.]|nr:helix-turn-helix domain-containing protein [Litoreibacter sp.]
MPKSATLSGIKSLHCYTIQEAAEVSGVSDRTIRAWIKDGLSAMTQERPTLLRGDALIAFIKGQRKSRRTKIKQDEFYCLKCRDARNPAERMVECEIKGTRAKLTAICEDCETIMHKPVALGQVPHLAKVFDLTVKSNSETIETPPAE